MIHPGYVVLIVLLILGAILLGVLCMRRLCTTASDSIIEADSPQPIPLTVAVDDSKQHGMLATERRSGSTAELATIRLDNYIENDGEDDDSRPRQIAHGIVESLHTGGMPAEEEKTVRSSLTNHMSTNRNNDQMSGATEGDKVINVKDYADLQFREELKQSGGVGLNDQNEDNLGVERSRNQRVGLIGKTKES